MEFLLRGTACGGPAGEQSPKQQNVGDWLHVFSVGILVVFAVHLFLQMVALQAEFFKTAHFLLDTLIIGSALVFELADFRQGDLITVLLLSRVVRVAHSVAHTVKMQQSNQVRPVQQQLFSGSPAAALQLSRASFVSNVQCEPFVPNNRGTRSTRPRVTSRTQ
jgi:hypothetical protein